jgi:hypothetical protein
MTYPSAASDFAAFQDKFVAANPKGQLQLLATLDSADPQTVEFLQSLLTSTVGWSTIAQGKAYQLLYESALESARAWLQEKFPQGIVPLKSEAGVDYQELQSLLAQRQWQAADKLTNLKLCELAGPTALQRQWLYFTDVPAIPTPDLQLIDRLWLVHSEGQFGFSVQRELWLAVNRNWDKLWPKIGWKSGINWTRYPGSFTWSLAAPRGHLPLSNQLRGVRAIAALMDHPAWQNSP